MGKTVGAVACVIVTLILWVEALAALLRYARAGDPGAYLMVGGVFLMLPGAVVVFLAFMSIDRIENRDRARSRELASVPERQPAQLHRTAPQPVETSWSQPRLVARETVTVRELFETDQPQSLPVDLRRIRPSLER